MRKLILLDSNIIIGIANNQIDADLFADLLRYITTVPITARIAKQAGLLTRTKRKQSADLLIAATALEMHIPLCTKNVKDFRQIRGLELISF